VAGGASVPFPVNTRAFYYVADPRDGRPLADSYVCNIPPGRMATMKTIFLASTFALFVVPMLAIVGLYAAIGLTLRRRARVELAAVVGEGRAGAAAAAALGGDGPRGRAGGVRIEMTTMQGRRRHAIDLGRVPGQHHQGQGQDRRCSWPRSRPRELEAKVKAKAKASAFCDQ